MSITLTPEQERRIQQLLQGSRYSSIAAIIDEALQLLEERDRLYRAWLEENRKKVEEAISELDRGEALDGETVKMQILERFQQV